MSIPATRQLSQTAKDAVESRSPFVRLTDLIAEPLFAADLVPVCAPALAAGLHEPAKLREATLLQVAHAPDD